MINSYLSKMLSRFFHQIVNQNILHAFEVKQSFRSVQGICLDLEKSHTLKSIRKYMFYFPRALTYSDEPI